MLDRFKFIAGAMLACTLSAPADAQVLMRRDISLEMAKTMAEAAMAMCREQGYSTSVAVVDHAANVILIMRGDGASPQNAEMARRKAFTARMFRRTSAEWAQRTLDDPVTFPQRDLADVIALAGGVPVMIGDEAIGAIGSAGSTQVLDDACAKAGVAAVADQLR